MYSLRQRCRVTR